MKKRGEDASWAVSRAPCARRCLPLKGQARQAGWAGWAGWTDHRLGRSRALAPGPLPRLPSLDRGPAPGASSLGLAIDAIEARDQRCMVGTPDQPIKA
jgi:hypothetical protein